MNSAVLIKIEYRLIEDSEFTVLKNIIYSGKLSESIDRSNPGDLHKTKIDFHVSKICTENELVLKLIKNRKAQFRLVDANKVTHMVGDDNYPARLTYQKSLLGTPGSFNGYRCTITCSSPFGSSVL